jgi:hypothetical protein
METETEQQVETPQYGDLRISAESNIYDKFKNEGSIAESADEF